MGGFEIAVNPVRGGMFLEPNLIGIPHPARGAMFIEPEVIGILHPARGAM